MRARIRLVGLHVRYAFANSNAPARNAVRVTAEDRSPSYDTLHRSSGDDSSTTATLALLRRLTTPFNLLVLDKHPDWVRGVPLLHCGTWLAHALQLPGLQRVFHVGGDLDFDNGYRWLAPWHEVRSGRVVVLPAFRRYERGRWATLPHETLRPHPDTPATPERFDELLTPYRADLANVPLYVTIDKDALNPS